MVHTNKDGMQDAGGARTQGSVQRPRQPGSPPPQGRMMDELRDVDLMEVDPMMHDIFDLFGDHKSLSKINTKRKSR